MWPSSDLRSWYLHHSRWQVDLNVEWQVHEAQVTEVQSKWLLLCLWERPMVLEDIEGHWGLWDTEVKFWAERLSEMVCVESMTTESTYLFRVRKNRKHWPIVTRRLTLCAGSAWATGHRSWNPDVDLAEESELVDLEETLRCCKLALRSEIVVDSELLAADCSTSIDGFDDLIFHRPDNVSFLFHSHLCGPFDHFGSVDFSFDSDSMTEWSVTLPLILSSFAFWLPCLILEMAMRILLTPSFFEVFLIFHLCLCVSWPKLTSSFLFSSVKLIDAFVSTGAALLRQLMRRHELESV